MHSYGAHSSLDRARLLIREGSSSVRNKSCVGIPAVCVCVCVCVCARARAYQLVYVCVSASMCACVCEGMNTAVDTSACVQGLNMSVHSHVHTHV